MTLVFRPGTEGCSESDTLWSSGLSVHGGDSAKDFFWPNDVFDIHCDKKVIEWVHGQADGYNKDLKIISDSLMQKDSKVGQMKGSNKKSKVNDMYKTIDTVFIDMIML